MFFECFFNGFSSIKKNSFSDLVTFWKGFNSVCSRILVLFSKIQKYFHMFNMFLVFLVFLYVLWSLLALGQIHNGFS